MPRKRYPDPTNLLPIPLALLIHAQRQQLSWGRGERNRYHENPQWRVVSVTRSSTRIADGADSQDCFVHWLGREPGNGDSGADDPPADRPYRPVLNDVRAERDRDRSKCPWSEKFSAGRRFRWLRRRLTALAWRPVRPRGIPQCMLPARGPAGHATGHSLSQWPDSTRDHLTESFAAQREHAFERLQR